MYKHANWILSKQQRKAGSYQNNKEKLSKEALEWFQNLLEKKKKKARILP